MGAPKVVLRGARKAVKTDLPSVETRAARLAARSVLLTAVTKATTKAVLLATRRAARTAW